MSRMMMRQRRPVIVDAFGRADEEPITGWVGPINMESTHTSAALRIWSNRLAGSSNPPVGASGTNCSMHRDEQLLTSDVEVRGTLVDMVSGITQSNYSTYLIFRMPIGDGVFGALTCFRGAFARAFVKQDSASGQTSLATSTSTTAVPAGSRMKVRAVGQLLKAYQNGVLILSFTDASNVIPRDSSHLYVGADVTVLRTVPAGAVSYGPGWDDFWARDVAATDLVTSQAIYLSTNTSLATGSFVTIGNAAVLSTAANGVFQKAGYDDTSFEGNGALFCTGAGTVTCNAKVTTSASATNLQIQILKNGVAQATSAATTGTTQTVTTSPFTVAWGDLVSFQAKQTSGLSKTMTAGTATTYLEMIAS